MVHHSLFSQQVNEVLKKQSWLRRGMDDDGDDDDDDDGHYWGDDEEIIMMQMEDKYFDNCLWK